MIKPDTVGYVMLVACARVSAWSDAAGIPTTHHSNQNVNTRMPLFQLSDDNLAAIAQDRVAEHDYTPTKTPRYYQLNAINRTFEAVARGQNRVKMPKLNQEALTAFLVPVPPLAEQERIVARVTELRRLCSDLRQRLTRSGDTKAALAEALIDDALVT